MTAPQTTVEAVMYELREDGLAALKVPNCQRRLIDLCPEQLDGVIGRLIKLRPKYPEITDELLAVLDEMRR
jgi:hypothetical protein